MEQNRKHSKNVDPDSDLESPALFSEFDEFQLSDTPDVDSDAEESRSTNAILAEETDVWKKRW